MASSQGILLLSGSLIFVSYWLDMLDGFFARKLKATSEFGLNLDSLTDMVALGVAPTLLVFQHLRLQGANLIWVTPMVILIPLAGGFRLARFNTLPTKLTSNSKSLGLTISHSGFTLALAVLADNLQPGGFLPILVYVPLVILLGVMMISRIPFLPSQWFFKEHKLGWVLLGFLLLLLFILPLFSVWFIVYIVYILVSTVRALILKLRPGL